MVQMIDNPALPPIANEARARLERAEMIIDVQKKVAGLLGIPLKTLEDEENG